MRQLSAAKTEAIATVVRTLPDEALRTLRSGLASSGGGWIDSVRGAVEAQIADRRLRDALLHELHTAAIPGPTRPELVPADAVVVLWSALREAQAEALTQAESLLVARDGIAFDAVALEIVAEAADGLSGLRGAYAQAATLLDERHPEGAARTERVLRLMPLLRVATPRARDWLRLAGSDTATYLRMAVRDASAACRDGGAVLLDLIAANFSEPNAGLRLVSAAMNRPSEAFLAASELSHFAERVLEAADDALALLRDVPRAVTRAEGAAAAAAVDAALASLEEMEHAVALDREQPWGRRVHMQKRALAAGAEARLKEADRRVAAALPVQASRPGLRTVRGAPCFDTPMNPAAVGGAQAALAFVEGVRRAAARGGFGGLRARVLEALDSRIDTYAEDLLEELHTGRTQDADVVRERLRIAADFLGMVRDPEAAQIIRRRMVAA